MTYNVYRHIGVMQCRVSGLPWGKPILSNEAHTRHCDPATENNMVKSPRLQVMVKTRSVQVMVAQWLC